jgi:hypothetical protein
MYMYVYNIHIYNNRTSHELSSSTQRKGLEFKCVCVYVSPRHEQRIQE